MRNIALKLSYDGTGYHGWQRQKNAVTVQETLENALSEIVKSDTKALGCGRTDAGVHARVYCANFRTDGKIPADRLPLALNAVLPDDISVSAAAEVEEDFHAVFSSIKKEYTYYVHNGRFKNPFYRNRAYFYPERLDLGALREAAAAFVGTHDFSAVRSTGTNVKTTVRTVYGFEALEEGDLLALRISANGFLYNMARAMAGTVLYAAIGKIKPEEIASILESGDRRLAGPTVPPHGLYMTGIWYGGGSKAAALLDNRR